MNKTEKLRQRIGIWLPDDRKDKVITAILCECKEAWLMFTEDTDFETDKGYTLKLRKIVEEIEI